MIDINDFIPRPKGMRWGSITNFKPTKSQYMDMNKYLPHDNKWHTILNSTGSTMIDGKEIRRRTSNSMT